MTQQAKSGAYDMIDRYLRNNMDDVDYDSYSQALDVLAESCAQAPKSDNPDFITIPVEYQYAYPDGHWRCSNGVTINGDKPVRARALYARKDSM